LHQQSDIHHFKQIAMLTKNLLFISLLILSTSFIQAQQPVIIESAGWFETAFVRWEPVANAQSYHVYVTGEGIINRRIDTQLIRNYGTYFRADVPGLKSGSYTLHIAPVIAGIETAGATTQSINVSAHIRSGFAFANGRVPGAYKADGTPKDNAVIIYITENTKNTVSMNVTGANANPCVGLQAILDGFKKGRDNRPLIIRMIGQITDPALMYNGDIVIENANNANSFITLEGIGDDAVADGWGIRIKNASNIEIRNIATMNCDSSEGDNIGLQQENEYIWVHNCDFFYGHAGTSADQIKGDGALDAKRSTFVTFSFNHFWDSGKVNLVGLSENTTSGLFITFHHNWFDHSDSRHPRVRFYSAHVYNNYYDGISKYGIGSTMGSSIFSEANYFRNCRYPMLISMQGSDVWDESKQVNDYNEMPTFSKEDGGIIKAFNNFMTGQRRFVAYGASGFPNSTVDFDAVVVSSRNETIPATITSSRGGNIYNNFDTNPAAMYTYTADSPEQARDRVMQFAGRLNGGDFKWTFNNAVDDTSFDVIPGLKNALMSYKTKLVSIQGDGENQGGGNTGGGEPVDVAVHNFTLHGSTSTFFNITGNLSNTKGTVNYAGLTLTQCLKLESTTLITFATTEVSILTLVLNHDFNGTVKINGTDRTATAGIITVEIPAGSHRITRGNISNLFYMSVSKTTTAISNLSVSSLTYPNPVREMLFIDKNIKVDRLEIYSISGVLMYRSVINNNQVDVSTLNSGTYLIRIYSGNEVFNQRIIKQ